MNAIIARIQAEPVMTMAVIQATISMAVGFGLNWTGQQVSLVTLFGAAVLGWIARSKVTPT